MKPRLSILVVEDDPFIIESLYKEFLSSLDVDVDYAQSKLEATEKIRCKTYNIAFVDIMLREDPNDRGGVEVIEFIHQLNEGTAVIVVSATDDIKVALVTYKEGIVDFIQKENIHTEKDLLYPIEKILNDYDFYKLNLFGRFVKLTAYLASPELTPYWEDVVRNTLNVEHHILMSTLNNTLHGFLPILRKKDSRFTLTTDAANRSVSGAFWSKGVGCPIWFSAANENGVLVEPPENQKGDILDEQHKKNLRVVIWKMVSVKRDEFRESVWDEIK